MFTFIVSLPVLVIVGCLLIAVIIDLVNGDLPIKKDKRRDKHE